MSLDGETGLRISSTDSCLHFALSFVLCACRVSKGDTIFIPILVINRSKEIWGEDALEFKYVFTF